MEQIRALEVIQSLAAGTDPFTGEILGPGSSLQNPEVVRALFVAAAALQSAARPAPAKTAKTKDPAQPSAAGKAWPPAAHTSPSTGWNQTGAPA